MSKRETISPLAGPFGDSDVQFLGEADVQTTVQVASVSQV